MWTRYAPTCVQILNPIGAGEGGAGLGGGAGDRRFTLKEASDRETDHIPLMKTDYFRLGVTTLQGAISCFGRSGSEKPPQRADLDDLGEDLTKRRRQALLSNKSDDFKASLISTPSPVPAP